MKYVSKNKTYSKILEVGKRSFLTNGYDRTNLRDICKELDLTTGAFYRHFDGKMSLFKALVDDSINELEELYKSSEIEFFNTLNGDIKKSFLKASADSSLKFVNFIYDHFDAFTLLLKCSDGTPYEDFVNELVLKEDEHTLNLIDYLKRNKYFLKEVNRTEIHMLNHAYFACIFEAVLHKYKREEAISHISTVIVFFCNGWANVLGL